jgi:hypothetical protein
VRSLQRRIERLEHGAAVAGGQLIQLIVMPAGARVGSNGVSEALAGSNRPGIVLVDLGRKPRGFENENEHQMKRMEATR